MLSAGIAPLARSMQRLGAGGGRTLAALQARQVPAVVPARPSLAAPRSSHVRYSTLLPEREQQPEYAAWPAAGEAAAPLTAEDKLAIIDLCHRFDHYLNSGQQHALGQFFAADAELHHPKGVASGGPDALVAYFLSCAPLARGNRHLTLNVVVEPGPAAGTARASAYRLLHRAANPPLLLASGTIEDELVKCGADGRWRFLRRRFIMDPLAAAEP